MYRATTDTLGFTTAGSEAMRIDSSGNLLVGTTDANIETSSSGEGVVIKSDRVSASRTSGVSANFNRISSDGNIVQFRKDGSVVGSIGVQGDNKLVIGSNDTGIRFAQDNDALHPWNATTNGPRDAAIDLGADSIRFKDLYLSGGAYLGGTAAANHLDDYEEGTWTPAISGSTTAGAFTYSIQEGKYTKVGNSVSVNCAIYVSATSTSPAGSVKITGLPFTIGNQFPSFAVGWSQFITFTDQLSAYGGGAQITLRDIINGGSGSNIQGSAFGSAFYIFVSGTYQV
jgi:hypothetical protein